MKHNIVVIILVAALSVTVLCRINAGGSGINSVLSRRVTAGYDKDQRPGPRGRTADVEVAMHISHAEWHKHKLTTILYLRQSWKDQRLASSSADRSSKYGPGLADEIWVPDTYVSNSIEVHRFHQDGSFTLSPQGSVMWSQRVKLTTPCRGHLARLGEASPHRLNCTIGLESYSYTNNEVAFHWKSGSGSALTVSNHLDNIKRHNTEQKSMALSTGTYSKLIATLYIESQPLCQLEACVSKCFAGE